MPSKAMRALNRLARLGLAAALLAVFTHGNSEQQTELPAGMGARAEVEKAFGAKTDEIAPAAKPAAGAKPSAAPVAGCGASEGGCGASR